MRTYHVEFQGLADTKTVDFSTREAAEKLWDVCFQFGKPATAYYIEDEKVYDLFTDEEIIES